MCISAVRSPPSSKIIFGFQSFLPSIVCLTHHQYSSSVSPFQANTGIPAFAIAAAAWSCVEQIIANLLDNSISFSSPNQEIVVDVFNNKDGSPTIAVIDEGTGFIEKDTNKIFNRFYSNRPKNFGEHSGLGLNIVKNLVELHNGQIKAENNANKGAKVEIIFPATQWKVDYYK